MFVYIKSESSLWTVGHYGPDGKWVAESDQDSETAAANRVAFLNGGPLVKGSMIDVESLGVWVCSSCGGVTSDEERKRSDGNCMCCTAKGSLVEYVPKSDISDTELLALAILVQAESCLQFARIQDAAALNETCPSEKWPNVDRLKAELKRRGIAE